MQHLKVSELQPCVSYVDSCWHNSNLVQAICFVRPTEENISLIRELLAANTYGEYYLCTSASHNFWEESSTAYNLIAQRDFAFRMRHSLSQLLLYLYLFSFLQHAERSKPSNLGWSRWAWSRPTGAGNHSIPARVRLIGTERAVSHWSYTTGNLRELHCSRPVRVHAWPWE